MGSIEIPQEIQDEHYKAISKMAGAAVESKTTLVLVDIMTADGKKPESKLLEELSNDILDVLMKKYKMDNFRLRVKGYNFEI